MRRGLRSVRAKLAVPVQATWWGSVLGSHFVDGEVSGYRDVAAGNSGLRHEMFLGMMIEGFLTASNLVGGLSTEISEVEIDGFVSAFRRVLARQL